MQLLAAPKDEPLRLAFSPDGRYLAGGGGRAFHLWELTGGTKPLWVLTKNDLALNFLFNPDGAELRGGSYSEFSRYDVRTGRAAPDTALCEFDPRQFSPDGRFGLAVVSDRDRRTLRLRCGAVEADGCAELWRKDILYDSGHEPAGYRALMFSADGGRLARVAGRGGRDPQNMTPSGLDLFDSASGKLITEWTGDLPYYARNGAVSPAGVVALINGRAIHVVDPNRPGSKPMKHVNASPKPLEAVAFTRDGSRLVAVGRDATATLWDTATWEIVRRYEWKVGPLKSVAFAPDGLRCAAGRDNKQVVVWDLD